MANARFPRVSECAATPGKVHAMRERNTPDQYWERWPEAVSGRSGGRPQTVGADATRTIRNAKGDDDVQVCPK
jgi:hypothetical protein